MKILNLVITENGTHIYTVAHNDVIQTISFSKSGIMNVQHTTRQVSH